MFFLYIQNPKYSKISEKYFLKSQKPFPKPFFCISQLTEDIFWGKGWNHRRRRSAGGGAFGGDASGEQAVWRPLGGF